MMVYTACMPSKPPRYRPTPKRPSFSETARPNASQRGYDARWQKARLAFLADNPLCARCKEASPPRITEATVVDHIIPHKGDQSLFWSVTNWCSLCTRCHDSKTATEDGGFGRTPKKGQR